MNDIPSDLAEAVRHAAEVVPDERHSLADVHRRRRRHQRRRVGTVAGVAAVAVAAGAAGVPLLSHRSGPAPEPFATASATVPAGPAQRLLLTNAYQVVGNVGVRGPQGVGEVDAAGKLVGHPVVGVDAADSVIGLPDGRLVMLGPHDLKPGVAREDGVNVTDLEFVLVVTTPAAPGPAYHVNVRTVGESVRLIGATATGAYLLRDGKRVVFHEFGSGAEQKLAAASAAVVNTNLGDDPGQFDVSVQGGRLLFSGVADDGSAQVRVHDLATGADLLGGPVTVGAPGTAVRAVRLSPDGRHVAVGLSRLGADRTDFILATVPVAARPRPRSTVLGSTGDNRNTPGDIQGIAFTDDRTVRVAWYVLPPGADRVYDLAEVLKVNTATV
ncbi:hypothetical protein [Virgisporangium aurantiacum]|uniref:Uncharacterized protein n=1 Tax=Virgisporangium aurantiacum TaxID=175570 RepID=A0A8J4E483_9ACTN|nr:hypothetical protein [Virgisporangium aurantiacum]GIJ60941.1 hypothetical protein Vau01_084570 [Virgisporangium aurantiacum]